MYSREDNIINNRRDLGGLKRLPEQVKRLKAGGAGVDDRDAVMSH